MQRDFRVLAQFVLPDIKALNRKKLDAGGKTRLQRRRGDFARLGLAGDGGDRDAEGEAIALLLIARRRLERAAGFDRLRLYGGGEKDRA